MSIEPMRGCGFRKVGGIYLVSSNIFGVNCDRLPYPLTFCRVCGEGVHQSRGFTWLQWPEYAGEHVDCRDILKPCMVCNPKEFLALNQPKDITKAYGLMWVGESNYSADTFMNEARTLGVSKRIAGVPRNFEPGKTVVLLAHPHAINKKDAGIFAAFIPQRVEMLIWQSEATDDKLKELESRGITAIIVPDGDTDHAKNSKVAPPVKDMGRFLDELSASFENATRDEDEQEEE